MLKCVNVIPNGEFPRVKPCATIVPVDIFMGKQDSISPPEKQAWMY